MIAVVFWVVVILIHDLDWERGIGRAIMLVLVVIATLVLMWLLRQPIQPAPRQVSVVLAVICTCLLCWHFVRLTEKLPKPKLIDIGTTTLSAVDALLEGKNPYTLPIDLPDSAQFHGYKYMPMMPVTYLPLGAVLRERGILLTNLLLDLATAALVFQLGARIGAPAAGWFATVLYLMLPFVPIEIYKHGVTDLSAIVPLLIAFLYVEKKPGWAGVCVGLSLSTKLLPGVLFIPCCLPSAHRGWYAAGITIGLVPTLVFLALSPRDLIYNAVLFSIMRSVDSTSWSYGMTAEPRMLVTAVVAVAVLSIAVYVWCKRPTLADRCGFGVICIIGSLLIGPINHRNYQLWWLPLFAVLLGAATYRHPTLSSYLSKRPTGVERIE